MLASEKRKVDVDKKRGERLQDVVARPRWENTADAEDLSMLARKRVVMVTKGKSDRDPLTVPLGRIGAFA